MKTVGNPEILAEAAKLERPIDPASGEEVERLIKAALKPHSETMELLPAAMK